MSKNIYFIYTVYILLKILRYRPYSLRTLLAVLRHPVSQTDYHGYSDSSANYREDSNPSRVQEEAFYF